MKKILFVLVCLCLTSCNIDDDPTIYNLDISVLENLNNGVPPSNIVQIVGVEAMFGLEFAGGFIFHYEEEDGSLIVATDYSQFGNFAWGDVFNLDTSVEIGSGDENTQLIVQGNLADNSLEGIEFGGDDYSFKHVSDLNYNGFDDWFIPSRNSMTAIYENIHSQGLGNFDENIIYWSSTKIGYNPYVMGFNFDSWGGEPFLGSCASLNGLMIARKVLYSN